MSATETKPLELVVSVKGEILKSNFDDFEAYALEQLEGINTDLNTDEEFGQAVDDEKALKETESKFKEVENQILAEMDAVSDLIKRTRGLGEKYSKKRLALGKELRSRKAEILEGIKKDAIASISIRHPHATLRIAEAMKGKRTLESLQKHATAEAVKIEAEVQRAREVVEQFRKDHGDDVCYDDVCYDEGKLLIMEAGLVEAELSRRVERKAAALKEAELRAEAEKLKAEAAAKAKEEPELKIGMDGPTDSGNLFIDGHNQAFQKSEPKSSIPDTVGVEFAGYLDTVRKSCAPFKAAREALVHTENIEKAKVFSAALNAAFAKLKGGADE